MGKEIIINSKIHWGKKTKEKKLFCLTQASKACDIAEFNSSLILKEL